MRNFNKIFCIGLTKTGTNSLTEALNILGIPILHYPDSKETFNLISEGKFLIPELSRRGISDVMAATYYPQFDKQYPDSLFIMTIREKEAWLKSVQSKLRSAPRPKTLSYLLRVATYGIPVFEKSRFSYVHTNHSKGVLKFFQKRDDLLVMNICAGEGWGALCSFLKCPVPDQPFPFLKRPKREWEKMKTCSKCKKTKNFKEFYPDNRNRNNLSSFCKTCYSDASRQYYKNNRDKILENIRKQKYNLDAITHSQMLEEQNGVCAICKLPPTGKTLGVDHNHKTGKVRGLLCLNCNFLLGFAKETIENLKAAIRYLENHS